VDTPSFAHRFRACSSDALERVHAPAVSQKALVCVSACRSHGGIDIRGSYPSELDMLTAIERAVYLVCFFFMTGRQGTTSHGSYVLTTVQLPRDVKHWRKIFRYLRHRISPHQRQRLSDLVRGGKGLRTRVPDPYIDDRLSQNMIRDAESEQTSRGGARSFCKPPTDQHPW
jgi:hypothetical protein